LGRFWAKIRQFWELIERIRSRRRVMSIVVAAAYMEEAERFDWLVAMDQGRVLTTGAPAHLRSQTGTRTVEDAFIALLPERQRAGHRVLHIPPRRIVVKGAGNSQAATIRVSMMYVTMGCSPGRRRDQGLAGFHPPARDCQTRVARRRRPPTAAVSTAAADD
jgi:hypothetical protein